VIVQFVKKQGILLWRNRMQLLLLIGLPIVLISILGIAFGGMLDGETPTIDIKVALIENENEEEEFNRFISDIDTELPSEVIDQLQLNKESYMLISMLKNKVFGNEEMSQLIDFHEVNSSEREEILNDETYTSVIEVPENFTYHMLENMILAKENQPTLLLRQNEGSQLGTRIVNDILTQFQAQLTQTNFLMGIDIDPLDVQLDSSVQFGESVTINQKEPITTQGYYTIGMAVMNVLFIASTLGTFAFLEKKIHVFDRIILADVPRWVYFIAVCISGTLFSFLQLLVIYGFAWAVFGVSWPDVIAFLTITAFFSISVGGIAALLTALSYRFNSEVITNFFSSIIVTVMAILGGSFFPIGDAVPWLQSIGNFTPNGAGMSAYLAVMRGDSLAEITHHIYFLIAFACIAIVIAALSFPKRGAIR